MQKKDCEEVAKLDKAAILNPWSVEDFAEAVKSDTQIYLVAQDKQQIIGFVGMVTAADEGDITHIAVDALQRRKHVATLLLEKLFQISMQKQIKSIFLEVRQHNEPAQKLYEKMGFESMGVRKNYYHNPIENAIIMKKEL